jgi:transposase
MKEYHYVGLDVHKKKISYCVKMADGSISGEGEINATRGDLLELSRKLPQPCMLGMEATQFTGWIYDFLKGLVDQIKVGHSLMLKAICVAKKKNDRLDARKIADAMRCDWFPESYMPDEKIRELRMALRYRNLLVREETRMKNKTAGLLMEAGAQYNKEKLHGKKYFGALMEKLEYVPETVKDLLMMSHASAQYFQISQRKLVNALKEHPLLKERVERLMSIPGVGEITALTWALEIADPHRFRTVKDAVSYCGLCSSDRESAGKKHRAPLSKQRNKHLQRVLIEAAKLATNWNPGIERAYEKSFAHRSNRNEATIEAARKLVAYLMCVDKTGKTFELKTA